MAYRKPKKPVRKPKTALADLGRRMLKKPKPKIKPKPKPVMK